jgi:hypothetical protein
MEALARNDRDAVVAGIAERTGLTRAEADRIVSDMEGRAARTEVDTTAVRQAAEDVAGGAAQAAWWALLALVLSAGTAAGGSAITAKD